MRREQSRLRLITGLHRCSRVPAVLLFTRGTPHMDQPDPFGFIGLTYDDVMLLPGHTDVIPSEASTTSRLTKRISVNVPLLSAAMDTVTEARMAIAMARQGGIGILHRNMSIDDQAA